MRVQAWLAHYSNGPTQAEASYDFRVDQPERYRLWLRASAYQTRMWYALDNGPRVEIDTDTHPIDIVPVVRRHRSDLLARGVNEDVEE